jgi:hypothetical protein
MLRIYYQFLPSKVAVVVDKAMVVVDKVDPTPMHNGMFPKKRLTR